MQGLGLKAGAHLFLQRVENGWVARLSGGSPVTHVAATRGDLIALVGEWLEDADDPDRPVMLGGHAARHSDEVRCEPEGDGEVDMDAGPIEGSPGYRASLKGAGRGRLL